MTPLDPDRCDYIKKNGGQCLRSKGWGTDHAGAGRCKTHGGNSPSHIKAAAVQIAASLAHEADVEPLEVLLRTIRLDWGAVQWVTGKIIEAEEKGDEKTPLVYQGLYGAWLDRAAKHAKLALDAGSPSVRSEWPKPRVRPSQVPSGPSSATLTLRESNGRRLRLGAGGT
jgi:hypothetical protein